MARKRSRKLPALRTRGDWARPSLPASGQLSRREDSLGFFRKLGGEQSFKIRCGDHAHGVEAQQLHHPLVRQLAQSAGQEERGDQRRVNLDGDALGAFRQPMPLVGAAQYAFQPSEKQFNLPSRWYISASSAAPKTSRSRQPVTRMIGSSMPSFSMRTTRTGPW